MSNPELSNKFQHMEPVGKVEGPVMVLSFAGKMSRFKEYMTALRIAQGVKVGIKSNGK